MLPPINTWTYGKERKTAALGRCDLQEYRQILQHVAPSRTEKAAKIEFFQKLKELPIPRLRLYEAEGIDYVPPPLRLPRLLPPTPPRARGGNSCRGRQPVKAGQVTGGRGRGAGRAGLQSVLGVQSKKEEEYIRLKHTLLPAVEVTTVNMLDNLAKQTPTRRRRRHRERKSSSSRMSERDEATAILVTYFRRCKESLRRDGRLTSH